MHRSLVEIDIDYARAIATNWVYTFAETERVLSRRFGSRLPRARVCSPIARSSAKRFRMIMIYRADRESSIVSELRRPKPRGSLSDSSGLLETRFSYANDLAACRTHARARARDARERCARTHENVRVHIPTHATRTHARIYLPRTPSSCALVRPARAETRAKVNAEAVPSAGGKVTVPLSRVPGSPGSRQTGSRLIHQNRRRRRHSRRRIPRSKTIALTLSIARPYALKRNILFSRRSGS